MICPHCKNPIQDNSLVCEWCDTDIVKAEIHNEKSHRNKVIKFVFNGEWFLIDAYTEVYLNGVLKLKSSVKKGFNFEIENTSILPIIQFKIPLKNKILELPPLDITKNYLIEIEYSRMWGNYSSKPKLIKEF